MKKKIFTHFTNGDYIDERFEIAQKMVMGLEEDVALYLKGELAVIIVLFPIRYQHYPYMKNYADEIVLEEEKTEPFNKKTLYVIGVERILLLELDPKAIPSMSYIGIRRSAKLNISL